MNDNINKIFFLVVLLLVINLNTYSQIDFYNIPTYSTFRPTDAHSISMGESFVANPFSVSSAFYNPANIVGTNGSSLFYTWSSQNYMDASDGHYSYSLGFKLKTPIGYWGLNYNRSIFGKIFVTSSDFPDGTGEEMYEYDYTISLNYAYEFFENFSAGINIKTFKFVTENNSVEPIFDMDSNNPIVIDFGILFNFNGFFQNDKLNDKFYIGSSIQNYGTDYNLKIKYRDIFYNTIDYEFYLKTPRFFRFGFMYNVKILKENKNKLGEIVLSTEYRNILSEKNPGLKDYYNFGVEGCLFDFFSVRLGGYRIPYDSNILGEKGTFNMRYGAGLNIPLDWFGINLPLSLVCNYAYLTLKNTKPDGLHSFDLELRYNNDLF